MVLESYKQFQRLLKDFRWFKKIVRVYEDLQGFLRVLKGFKKSHLLDFMKIEFSSWLLNGDQLCLVCQDLRISSIIFQFEVGWSLSQLLSEWSPLVEAGVKI